jgi:Ca2+-binding EF-hand superfamily protein
MTSKAYFAFLILEDSDGNVLDAHDSGGVGLISRIVHRTAWAGTYRVIATSQGGFRGGPFSLSVRTVHSFSGILPSELPPWFKDLDKNQHGQVTLHEWRQAGKDLDQFREYDLNDDGLITAEEILQITKKPIALKLQNGQATYSGAIDAADQRYQGRKISKFLTVRLEKGKTYQFDHMSKAFDAYLYLEDPEGNILAEDDDSGGNLNSRIVHQAAGTGIYRLIATSLGGSGLGPFSLAVVNSGGSLPKGVPPWFKGLDKDGDGQLSLHEWRAGGKKIDQFREYDRNDDGFITPEEVLQNVSGPIALTLKNGHTTYNGAIESADQQYQGRKTAKIFTVKMERGKTYQVDHMSSAFDAYLYLEDSEGNVLAQDDDSGGNLNSRIVHNPAKTGTYRLIATSLGGSALGVFALSVRITGGFAGSSQTGLPSWFRGLDKDGDGQVSLYEWRDGGKTIDRFRDYDLNDDGFITAEEVLQASKRPIDLKLENGQADYQGTMEEGTDARYQGRKTFKMFAIRLEAGKTYQVDLMSPVYASYLYLEDPEGNLLNKHKTGEKGAISRVVYVAVRTGTYRLIATSNDGNSTGAYYLAVRVRED